ncbi:hypothetical protein THAOC_31290 [Thalassiosira oceanica]|uniref:ribose-5-phosphate isomerase n=1 Tax=Thalassiosira oceanica TaxID=159749 RepID=K0RC06_THAOC|nr:hypothetical protein THAOC_31290 [Thalassiosira oceanica]|eukprot:EJK49799.1 hypothetical protein THAOC_31290 [Thalassiosira oceanica]
MKTIAAALTTLLSSQHVAGFAPAAGVSRSRSISSLRMAETALSQDELKKMVGYKSVDDYVESGMVVGLGTGSTAYFAVERLGQKLKDGELKDIVAIPTSVRTKEQAESLGIPLVTLDTHSKLDVAIDGADEVDPDLNLVKGGGGALLREKMVEVCADKFIVIVDESKLCDGLGPGFPLPVEITPFCHEHTLRTIASLPTCEGCDAVLRMGSSSTNKPDGDEIAVTDNGNYIVDLHFKEAIKDAPAMASELKNTVGVVDHGLFCDMTTAVIIAGSDGISSYCSMALALAKVPTAWVPKHVLRHALLISNSQMRVKKERSRSTKTILHGRKRKVRVKLNKKSTLADRKEQVAYLHLCL